MAIEAFAGSGIANYGVVFSWTVLRQVELAARLGQRQMTCAADQFNGTGGDCTRTIWNIGVRYFLGDRDFSPFVGAGFASTHATLAILHAIQMSGTNFLQGDGRANSLSASAGVQLAVSYVRLSLEYIFEYQIYTGANKNDMQEDAQRRSAPGLGRQPQSGPPWVPFPGGLCVLTAASDPLRC